MDNILNLKQIKLDAVLFQKMAFIFNSLEDGWTIRKKKDSYIFTKPHNKSKEIIVDTYLKTFLEKNFKLDNLIN
tara:strand:+ start:252 stop:473 length:222 start_codon:yes stop_codon:yes gene_type:complete